VSDAAFTTPAHWGGLIAGYFFFGGLAASSFAIAAILDLFGKPEDRPAARLGYFIALPLLLVCPPLLVVDLDRPERFWHLMLASERPGIIFKWWSPMSIGAWVLLFFGAFSAAAFAAALAEERGWKGKLGRLAALGEGKTKYVIAAAGAALGFFVAGYTGVLLAVTNRPIWSETPLLGGLFLVSSTSAAAAILSACARLRPRRFTESGAFMLGRVEHVAAALEIAMLVGFFAWTGGIATWSGRFGVLLLASGLLAAIVPLGAAMVGRKSSVGTSPWIAASAAMGSLGLRFTVVYAAEALVQRGA